MPRAVEPSWFTDAWAREYASHEIEVAGARIHYLVWEPPAPTREPVLVLLHGTAAHAHWWTHLAGILAEDRRVVAVDLSGHGDSAHRLAYDPDLWADEVLAVVGVVDPAGDGVCIVGHSLGGTVACVAAARDTRPVHGIAVCETVRDPHGSYDEEVQSRPRRFFATYEEAVARFRLVPAQPQSLPFVVDRIARHSVVEYPEGWSWKYDTQFVDELRRILPVTDDVLASVTCPLALIRSQHGLVSRDDLRALASASGPTVQTLELPAAGHHPMLDQPLAFLVAIRVLTAGWCT